MSRIELQIVALGNFSSVQSEFAKLNAQVAALNKNFSGVGINATDVARIKQYTKEFDLALRSTGAFTAKQVQLQSETEKFGKSLEAGHLKLRQYFSIINQGATQSQGALRNLAVEQTKLQNSIIVKDPLKGGLATVYTPTIINQATDATKIATNQQRLYNMAIDRGATSLINWGKNTQWAGRQLTVGLTVPLTMFGNAASKVFQQMDQELTRMQKVYGTGLVQPSQAALSAIRKDISGLASELAKSWGTPIKETAQMAADLAATGKTGLDLVNATREALRLATLGELDKQQAMQATVSLQNVYKLNTQQLSEAVNFLNAVENQTSTSLQDLVEAIPRVGPIVAQMGGSFKDTAAMMVAMKEAGVPAAQSANAIKSALASIINPTKAAREAFKAYGIDVASIAGNNKGNPVNMLVDLQQKLKDLSPLAKEQLIEKMFGKFQMSRISALLENLNKAGTQSKTVFGLMQASSGQLASMAQQELKIQTESTTGKYKRAVESLKADLLPIGEQFTKVITKIINFGDSIVKMLDKLGPMKNLLGFVLGFVAVAGPLIMLTGVFGNLFGYIMKGISLFRNMRTEGAGLKGITGLLTAENIAASQATQLMSQRMLEDVDATKLLASAIDQLNLKLESMVALISKASQGGAGVAVAQAEAMAVASMAGSVPVKNPGRYRSSKPKKFAQGGYVPGDPAQGDVHPALLQGGEAIIPAQQAQKYSSFINEMIGNTLPKYKNGKKSRAGDVTAQAKGSNSAVSEELELTQGSNKYQTGENATYLPTFTIATPSASYNTKLTSETADPQEWLNFVNKEGGRGARAHSGLYEFLKMQTSLTEKEKKEILEAAHKNVKEQMQKLVKDGKQVSDRELSKITSESYGTAMQHVIANNEEVAKSWDLETGAVGSARTQGRRYLHKSGEYRTTGGTLASSVKSIGSRMRSYAAIRKANLAEFQDNAAESHIMLPNFVEKFVGSKTASITGAENIIGKQRAAAIQEAKAITDSTKIVVAAAKKSGEEVDKAFGAGTGSQSKSRKAKKRALEYTQGAEEGLVQGTPALVAAAEKTGIQVDEAVGTKLNANNAKSKTKMSLGSRMGGGMGLMAASMAMSMVSDKIPGGSVLSGAMTGAGMGMMFGPWGAAAGAAIGLVTSGISELIKKEKEHTDMVKAAFSVDTNLAVTAFGDKIVDTTNKLNDLNKAKDAFAANNGKSGTGGFGALAFLNTQENVQAQTYLSQITQSAKGSSTQKFIESITGKTGTELTGKVSEYIGTQVSSGALKAENVKVAVAALLQAAGAASQFNLVYSNVMNRVKDISTATSTVVKKSIDAASVEYKKSSAKFIQQVISPSIVTGRSAGEIMGTRDTLPIKRNLDLLKDSLTFAQALKINISSLPDSMQGGIKYLQDTTTGFVNGLASGQFQLKNLDSYVSGIGKSAKNSAVYANMLKIALAQSSDPTLKAALTSIASATEDIGTQAKAAAAAQLLLNAGIDVNKYFDQSPFSMGLTIGQKFIEFSKSAKFEETVKQLQAAQKAIEDAVNGNGGTGGTSGTGTLDKLIANLEASKQALQDQKDSLDKSIQAQKNYNDQLKKTQDYLTSTTDLENQIRVARAKGDYLQVGLLKQQLASKQTEFTSAATISPAEQQSQNLADRILELTKQIQEANAQNKTIKTAAKAATKASGGYIPGYAGGSWGGVFGPGTTTSDSIPAYLSNGEYVLSANAVRNIPGNIKTLDKINGGDISSFNSSAVNNYSISVNVAGTNANPDQIAQAVLNTIQRRSNMNNTTRVI